MYELYFEREKVLVLEVFYYPIQTTPKWPRIYIGCPKKRTILECCWSHSALAQSQVAGIPCVWKSIFWPFLLRQSLIEPSQVMFMVKFSPRALNFGFVILTHFLGHPVKDKGCQVSLSVNH